MKYAHLERVFITLRTLSPLFIHSGKEMQKKDCIYDMNNQRIYFPDLPRLYSFLEQKGAVSSYESFLLNSSQKDLRDFLNKKRISEQDYAQFVHYAIDAHEAAQENHVFGVQLFIKGPDGLPFIPGSSVKGALRTAIAAKLAAGRNWDKTLDMLEATALVKYKKERESSFANQSRNLESQLFSKLNRTDPTGRYEIRWHDAVNDIMQAIRISDSAPLPLDRLTLCRKIDRKIDGSANTLNVYRECLTPGTSVRLAITLDMPLLEAIRKKLGQAFGLDWILQALQEFSYLQRQSFSENFPSSGEDARECALEGVELQLGGGVGFVSKTLLLPLSGHNRLKATQVTKSILDVNFSNHFHKGDRFISPRTLKLTRYKTLYYHMGRCELLVEKEPLN